jgi:hypothetical protein
VPWPSGISKKKTGGRKKGTPNRSTNALQHRLDQLEFDVLSELVKAFPALSPKEKVQGALQLLTFIYPRRKSLDEEQEVSDEANTASKNALAKRLAEQLELMQRDNPARLDGGRHQDGNQRVL